MFRRVDGPVYCEFLNRLGNPECVAMHSMHVWEASNRLSLNFTREFMAVVEAKEDWPSDRDLQEVRHRRIQDAVKKLLLELEGYVINADLRLSEGMMGIVYSVPNHTLRETLEEALFNLLRPVHDTILISQDQWETHSNLLVKMFKDKIIPLPSVPMTL